MFGRQPQAVLDGTIKLLLPQWEVGRTYFARSFEILVQNRGRDCEDLFLIVDGADRMAFDAEAPVDELRWMRIYQRLAAVHRGQARIGKVCLLSKVASCTLRLKFLPWSTPICAQCNLRRGCVRGSTRTYNSRKG